MNKTHVMQLSERIKNRRKSLAYPQEELSEKLELSHSHYSKIENAISSPSLDTLIKISKILGLSLDYIVFGKNENLLDKNYIKLNNIISTLKENNSQKISDLKNIIKLLELLDNL